MKLPRAKRSDRLTKKTQLRFGGYDALGTEGAICDMQNLTGEYFPELAVRRARQEWTESPYTRLADPMCFGEDPDGRPVWLRLYDDSGSEEMDITVELWNWMESWQRWSSSTFNIARYINHEDVVFARIGDYMTIWTNYDAIYYDFKNLRGGMIDALWSGSATFSGDTWNTMTFSRVLSGIRAGDALEISDSAHPANAKTAIVRGVETVGSSTVLTFDDYCFAAESEAYTEWVSLSRSTPIRRKNLAPMAWADGRPIVFTHENRLFIAANDTIYVSKLGDPFNWNYFDGTAMDSFAVDTGTPGRFTGGVSYGGYPRFFKEDRVFTLYGDYPAEYRLVEKAQPGVMTGCGGSVSVGNGTLFYLSRTGPCAFTGGSVVSLAEAFGTACFRDGVGCADDEKYYLCMTDADTGKRRLYTYDLRRGFWMIEDELDVQSMARVNGAVWSQDTLGVFRVHGRGPAFAEGVTPEEEDGGAIAWFAEFGDIAEQAPDKKKITKLMLRLELEDGAEAAVKLRFDSEDFWRTASTVRAGKKRSVVLPVIPRRYDHFRLRIEGTGICRISSLTFETAEGSDR